VLSICAEQDDTYFENREVKRLNFIGVLRKKFFSVFHPHHNNPLFLMLDFEHMEGINNFPFVFKKRSQVFYSVINRIIYESFVKVTAKTDLLSLI
jgi:hypothetical protein